MRGTLLALATAAVSVLIPAAPATTAVTAPQDVVASTVIRPLPDLRVRPDEGCTVPVGGSLSECPGVPRRPPVACVLPVADLRPGVLLPDCPGYDPSPESRIVPVVPLSR